MRVVVFFDGGCLHGVHGAGAAVAYTPDGVEIGRRAHYIRSDTVTNNVCEFCGLLVALELARDLGATDVRVLGDSELIVRQFNGVYQCRKTHLQPWLLAVRSAARAFSNVTVDELPKAGKTNRRRHGNAEADALATLCMREQRDLPPPPLASRSDRRAP